MAQTKLHYLRDYFDGDMDTVARSYKCVTGTTFTNRDPIEMTTAGLIQKAVAGSARIIGVAIEGVTNATVGQLAQVEIDCDSLYRTGYEGTTKQTLTDADVGRAFDYNPATDRMNLDDTLGGFLIVTAYNNTEKTADVLLTKRLFSMSPFGVVLTGSVVYNPGSLVDASGESVATIAVAGAEFGDYVMIAAPYDLGGVVATGYVSAPNTVTIRLQNETGGTLDLASGTWKALVIKG
jgi:hypothetical protein